MFSKEAVKRGDFARFIKDKQGKKPRAEIDRDFLNDLDNWRVLLARNIALRNPQLSGRELNYAVQMTLDRLIFLRMSEDRGIEAPYTLQALLNGEHAYQRLVEIYYRADERYNSGLFHFSEKDGANPDTVTPGLSIDDKLLKEIVKNLYYPDCPYEFSVLPVEVLGNAYEQFLGKRISLTAGHHARIEEKPEVRKAGGVYYTPRYIVDYIVQNTVGKLLAGKTPQEVSKLRILDPACGSGSFLLGAYQVLMDWHLDYYRKAIEKGGKVPQIQLQQGKRGRKTAVQAVFQGSGGDWFLSTTEKKRILLNNLYGVDIDANAVEVTKLSLLLKVLENENSETLSRQLGLWHERALPNLGSNIKCGNSLIGPDYYDDRQVKLFNEEEALRVNVFDWQREFKDIFSTGGFDAVIGNPPYGGDVYDDIKKYLSSFYETTQYKFDTFTFFIEKGIKLLKQSSRLGLIVPNTWLDTKTFSHLRNFILSNTNIEKIVNLGKNVFTANIDTVLIFISTNKMNFPSIEIIDASNYKENTGRISLPVRTFAIGQNLWAQDSEFRFNIYIDPKEHSIFEKMNNISILLGEISESSQGLIPYNTKEMSAKNPYISSRKESDEWKRFLDKGTCISRYSLEWNGLYIKFGKWLYTSNQPKYYENEKILVQRHRNPSLEKRIVATLDSEHFYFKDNLCCIISNDENTYSLKYLIGLLNSFLINKYYKKNFTEVSLNPVYLRQLPIRTIDFSDPADKARHDRMVTLVEQILDFHKQLSATREPLSREQLQRRIDATDSQIDRLVYELYDLTEEEIKVVGRK